MKYVYSFIIFFVFLFPTFSQKVAYSTLLIPDSLRQNANAVVRLDQMDIVISSQRNMNYTTRRIVTVLNEKGMSAVRAISFYDKKTSIQSIQAVVYDAMGNEIKKIKRKDFRDQSAVDGATIFSDSRVVYLEYTPTQYPFTIDYICEMESSNTAFIPQWYPLNRYFVSVEKSVLNVRYPNKLGFKKKEFNFSKFKVAKTSDTPEQLSYSSTNIPAQKEEYYSLENFEIFPRVMMGLEFFNLEGVDGNAKTWDEFGKWYSEKILSGTITLSEETIAKMKALVGNEQDPIKKAKIIYNYVQQKSRYVSIQVGIGGFKPMEASDVDRLGYGDCKALSNYTRALLNAVDVPAYYTILYGDQDKMNIESDFVSVQGNHVILTIPVKDQFVWLECTSQDVPFGYQANFTDDRDVLVIKPEGAEIIRTTNYQDKTNAQKTLGHYSISEDGAIEGSVVITSEGSQYNQKYHIETKSELDREVHYKNYWENISNLKLNKISFSNDKDKVQFTENVAFSAGNYGVINSNKMIFVVDAFNQYSGNIKRIRNRKTPFEIQRGWYDTDEISVALPQAFDVESLPNTFELNSKFGEYKTEIVKENPTKLVYKRTLWLKKGRYPNTDYENYRLFMEQIARNDNAKIVLTKK